MYWTSKDFVERDQDSNCYTGYHYRGLFHILGAKPTVLFGSFVLFNFIKTSAVLYHHAKLRHRHKFRKKRDRLLRTDVIF